MTWLVTGGAGYIGAHLVHVFRAQQADVVVLDDLSTGAAGRVPSDVPLERCTLLDPQALERVFSSYDITGVVHLAAKKRVDESVDRPLHYYHQNVDGLRVLLQQCVAAGVGQFLFSSSAAVYGEPTSLPVDEDAPCQPVNPYGQTKLAGEWLTHATGIAAGMRTVALRYFNVAGTATPELVDTGSANLVPLILGAIGRGERPTIFGDDYPTPDGTCIRDYIHVADVADAHLAAVGALQRGDIDSGATLNLGTGTGVSVRQMIDVALKVTGSDLAPLVGPRRPGDPPAVVAAVDREARQLGWTAKRDATDMLESAWQAMPAHRSQSLRTPTNGRP
jgi:UDP-glucose 4-epimerase